jgi:hypothetical protein
MSIHYRRTYEMLTFPSSFRFFHLSSRASVCTPDERGSARRAVTSSCVSDHSSNPHTTLNVSICPTAILIRHTYQLSSRVFHLLRTNPHVHPKECSPKFSLFHQFVENRRLRWIPVREVVIVSFCATRSRLLTSQSSSCWNLLWLMLLKSRIL